MKISAVYITKNEEANIEKSIISCKNIADEIIIVDTGSTDKTIEIVKDLGCSVYNFKWNDDFAEARNYAISLCKYDLILFLDADEYFASPLTVKNKQEIIETFLEDETLDAVSFFELDIDKDTNKPHHTGYGYKIFRHSSDLFYEGKIHETLQNRQRQLNICILQGLQLIHTGYSQSIVKSKVERNLNLLNKLEDKRTIDYFYLARENLSLGNFVEAEKNLLTFLEAEDFKDVVHSSNIGYLCYIYMQDIMLNLPKKYNYKDRIQILKSGQKEFPYLPQFYYELGMIYLTLDLDKSLKLFKQAIKKNEDYQNHHYELNNFLQIQPNIYYYMSKIYMLQKKQNEAIRTSIVSCMLDNRDKKHIGLLLHLLNRKKISENIELINKTLKLRTEEDYKVITQILCNCNLNQEFVHFSNIYNVNFKGNDNSVFYAMMLSGNSEIALNILAKSNNIDKEYIIATILLYLNNKDYTDKYLKYIPTYQNAFFFLQNLKLVSIKKDDIQKIYNLLCKIINFTSNIIPQDLWDGICKIFTDEQIYDIVNIYVNNRNYTEAKYLLEEYLYVDKDKVSQDTIEQYLLILYLLEDYTHFIEWAKVVNIAPQALLRSVKKQNINRREKIQIAEILGRQK